MKDNFGGGDLERLLSMKLEWSIYSIQGIAVGKIIPLLDKIYQGRSIKDNKNENLSILKTFQATDDLLLSINTYSSNTTENNTGVPS